MNRPEILAPAGSPAALEAAAACGADAVYLGVEGLNARRGAENFTLATLGDTVRDCHIQGVKVYLTLNILLLAQELDQLRRTVEAACAAGVDGVIVQDLGVLRLVRAWAPGLNVSASTQLSVHNPAGVRLLEQLGASRVVLARECSAQEIAAVCASTPLEVEVFVHGALCMCVSGQCYLSSLLGQRSGNRGLCAQPCRLPFQSPATGHALSLKDLSLIPRLQQLRECGVASLKIEGRMKRPEYVAAAVTACRQALEGQQPDLETLQAVFSRSGFTDGHFTGRRTLEMFGVRQKQDVQAAAGVLKGLEPLYTDPRRRVQRVEVDMALRMAAGQLSTLTLTDREGHRAVVEGPAPQPALTKPTTPQRAEASLSKTGGTPYRVGALDCLIGQGLMLPASALNDLRRRGLEELDQLRGAPRPVPCKVVPPQADGRFPAGPPQLRVRARRLEQLSGEMWQRAQLVTLPVAEWERLAASGQPVDWEKACAGLPRMVFSGERELQRRLEALGDRGLRHVSVGNLGTVELAAPLGFALHGEPYLNIANPWAAAQLADWDLCDLTASFELNLDWIKRLQSPIPVGILAYGRLALMVMRACPIRAAVGCRRCRAGENRLTDRRGKAFAVDCTWGCSELLNPTPLWLADRLGELGGLDFLTLDFTEEPPQEAAAVFAAYLHGAPPPGEHTRGLYYKTLL